MTLLGQLVEQLDRLVREVQGLRRDQARRGHGAADLLTLAEAARWARMSPADFTAWAEQRQLVRYIDGRRRVVVGELIDALDGRGGERGAGARRHVATRAREDRWRSLG